MLQNLQVVAGSVLTLFLLMGVGFFFGKKGMLSEETLSQLSRLLLYVVTPSIMITSFEVERTPENTRQLLMAAAALAGTYALYMALSSLLFRRQDGHRRGVLRFAAIYGNTGFMGLPLIQSVMGDQAMMIAVMALAVFNIATWTHGVLIIGGREHFSPRKAVLNPGVLGFAAGLLLFVAGWRLPGPVDAAVGYLGSLNTPLAMVIIGGQMAAANLPETFREKKLYLTSALKLLGMPLLTAVLLLPFHLDPIIFSALVILSACPTAGATSLFSQSMGKDTALAARQITLSTLLCVITLPVVAVLAQALAGGRL